MVYVGNRASGLWGIGLVVYVGNRASGLWGIGLIFNYR